MPPSCCCPHRPEVSADWAVVDLLVGDPRECALSVLLLLASSSYPHSVAELVQTTSRGPQTCLEARRGQLTAQRVLEDSAGSLPNEGETYPNGSD
ncbi:hypothetical protein chiPu_0024382 [Chiloscyllium punctatum]|uniref:Uncharacterized protein n=1 Tax=Chiloscyllium punctatum TaxID=137246 RepID=A0A401TC76_CHIPU|nr:hypothetical protein [Chiloscyllium punctatum]